MAASHHGDCNKYEKNFPPYFSTLGSLLLRPCQGAAGTPRSGAWHGNLCPPCRTASMKIGRKRKREQKTHKAEVEKQKAELEAEEKEILRELVIAKKKRLTPAAVAPAPLKLDLQQRVLSKF